MTVFNSPANGLWLQDEVPPKQYFCDVVVVDHFYIALFSALKQTHCARM